MRSNQQRHSKMLRQGMSDDEWLVIEGTHVGPTPDEQRVTVCSREPPRSRNVVNRLEDCPEVMPTVSGG